MNSEAANVEAFVKKYMINEEGRVVALRDFGDVKVGDVGGFVWSEKNLSHEGNCWIYENARVYGEAQVYENAQVCENARVCGNAWVFGNARVYGVMRSDGFSFCYVSCADREHRVIAGCRYFTMPEAREHWGTEHPKHEETCVILDALERLSKVREEGCV